MSILQQRTIAALLTSLVVATGPCLAESPAMPGTVTVEERLDLSETGENLTLGQVRAVRTYKGKVLTSMSYVDESGQLCAPSSRGYAIARYTYYDNKWLKTTEFFDAQGQPVNCSEGYQKIENIYTPNGMRTRRVYKNAQGEETIGPEGYSRMEAQYTNRRMIHQAFYNPDGELVNVPYARFDSVEEKGPFKKSGSHSLKAQYTLADGSLYYNAATGYARVENTYLNRQHRTRTAYFGADGKPIVNPVAGFSVEERVIGQDYQLAGVRYYDENGNPMIGPDGYSTILYFKHKERYCLVDGKIVSPFVPDMMPDSGEVQWKFAQHSTEFYLDENGYPLANEDGYCGRSVINFKTGRPSHIWYLGKVGEPVMTAMGYAMVRNSYTSKNLLIRSEYFDEQGKPIDTAEGYQRVESRYSLRKLEQEMYYDKNGNLVNCTDGYAEKLNAYDKRNNLVRQETLDIEGNRVGTCTVYVKDPDDHALSEMTLDDQDREKRNKNGYSEIRYEWNGVKNSQAYYFQGAPVMDVNGVHEIRYGYTVTGKVAEEAYYDIDGQPCENVRGVSRIVNEYNEDDDLIATYNYDISGNLTQMGREYAYSRKKYNDAHTEEL
ncbi:MAG: hypothetical protein J6B53_16365 [Clostridia bacterium]|nr:hypothetical protein [Clostridia bacterium]